MFDFDDPPPDPWNPSGETPPAMRDYFTVLAGAEPHYIADRDVYGWSCAPGEWLNLMPGAGVVPPALFAEMKKLSGHPTTFATRDGAIAALRAAVWRVTGEVR